MALRAMTWLAYFGDRLLRSHALRRAVLRRVRRRSLVLLYHRVGPERPRPVEVIPSVPVDLFAQHLDALSEIGEIVPLTELDHPPPGDRPRFALTFDDDEPGHREHALPVLRERGLHATFFLSGRWHHGLGPYWWEVLEEEVRRDGPQAVARRLGVRAVDDPVALAAVVLRSGAWERLNGRDGDARMTADDTRTLAAAGMGIGFHTVEHRLLTRLPDAALQEAVGSGRADLASCVARPVSLFSYPYGRAGRREATAVADAGYARAWTTAQRPVTPAVDPYLRGRWEPGPCPADALVRGALQRLARRPAGRERT